MENNTQQAQPTQAQASVNILAKAAELYVNGLDELAKALAIPQIQAAIQTLAQLADNERSTQESAKPAPRGGNK